MPALTILMDIKRALCNRTGLGNYNRTLLNLLLQHTPHQIIGVGQKYPLIPPPAHSQLRLELYPKVWEYAYRYFSWGLNRLQKQANLYHGTSAQIPRKLKIPSVVTIHDLIYLKYPNWFSSIDRLSFHHKTLYSVKNSQLIIAISNQTKRDIIDLLGIPESRIRVVYQPVNNLFIHPPTAIPIRQLIQQYPSIKENYFLMVGRIEPRKQPFFVLKALASIEKSKRPHLVLIGKDCGELKKHRSFLDKNQLQRNITHIPYLPPEHLLAFYQHSRALLFPSLAEGHGLPISEACSLRVPVFASDLPVLREVGGGWVKYLSPFDESEWIRVLSGDVSPPSPNVPSHFSLDPFLPKNIATLWSEVYQNLAN